MRKILVSSPKNWTKEQNMEFVELVNIKTKTGWIVTLVIENGDILITDPNVEKRTMIEFTPLVAFHNIKKLPLSNVFILSVGSKISESKF